MSSVLHNRVRQQMINQPTDYKPTLIISLKFDLWIFPKLICAEYLTRLPCFKHDAWHKGHVTKPCDYCTIIIIIISITNTMMISGSHIYNFRPCREWNKAECDCTATDATCPGGYTMDADGQKCYILRWKSSEWVVNNFSSIDGVDNDDADDDEETWDLTATLQLLCMQEPDFVPPVFFFPRKGQSSWSDANSRCQSEGDDSLAIITFVRSILWKKRLVWIKNLQLFCDWAAHFKEREWEHCSADGGHPAHWQGLYRPHRFGHRGEQTMREGFQNTVTDHPSKWPSIKNTENHYIIDALA